MKRVHFGYRVEMEIEVERAEHAVLMKCSESHYDARCRAQSKPASMNVGSNGLNSVEPDTGMLTRVRELFGELREETDRIRKLYGPKD